MGRLAVLHGGIFLLVMVCAGTLPQTKSHSELEPVPHHHLHEDAPRVDSAVKTTRLAILILLGYCSLILFASPLQREWITVGCMALSVIITTRTPRKPEHTLPIVREPLAPLARYLEQQNSCLIIIGLPDAGKADLLTHLVASVPQIFAIADVNAASDSRLRSLIHNANLNGQSYVVSIDPCSYLPEAVEAGLFRAQRVKILYLDKYQHDSQTGKTIFIASEIERGEAKALNYF